MSRAVHPCPFSRCDMTEQQRLQQWLDSPCIDDTTKDELRALTDPAEIKDRFGCDLSFGTAGLRGILGAGANRMNVYTVGRATQGLADYLNEQGPGASVAIAYDSRLFSPEFAQTAACVLAANGITAHLFGELMPTPVLSYTVRALHCTAGIVITASHNPAAYNGYKVYGADGCQIGPDVADAVLARIDALTDFAQVRTMPFEKGRAQGLIRPIEDAVVDGYLAAVRRLYQLNDPQAMADLRVVYTPLNGTGKRCVLAALHNIGINDIALVPEQAEPDGRFPTCPSPNPELREALEKGLELCRRVQPDLLLATDPDADRMGVAVHDGADYVLLTGNEIGVLLFDYVCRVKQARGALPQDPIVVSTIVSTPMLDVVAAHYGAHVIRTLTGFKFIGEQISLLEEKGETERFLFGFEESYGFLSGAHVRDKDAVNASQLLCEAAAYYKTRGQTLYDAMQSLYQAYGFYRARTLSFAFAGVAGMETMARIMEQFRRCPPLSICGKEVVERSDYQARERIRGAERTVIALPKSNVLAYTLIDGSTCILRPSGTEPKLKLYLCAKAGSSAAADAVLDALQADLSAAIQAAQA